MARYAIAAESFAAPWCSDSSNHIVEAESASDALRKFKRDYRHPYGLYMAKCFATAEDMVLSKPPLAVWLRNYAKMKLDVTTGRSTCSYEASGLGHITVDGINYSCANPKDGGVYWWPYHPSKPHRLETA